MSNESGSQWGRSLNGSLSQRWPRDASGQPEEPVFLCRSQNLDLQDE